MVGGVAKACAPYSLKPLASLSCTIHAADLRRQRCQAGLAEHTHTHTPASRPTTSSFYRPARPTLLRTDTEAAAPPPSPAVTNTNSLACFTIATHGKEIRTFMQKTENDAPLTRIIKRPLDCLNHRRRSGINLDLIRTKHVGCRGNFTTFTAELEEAPSLHLRSLHLGEFP